MSYIAAEELDFLSFFEVEPEKLDKNSPWVYNSNTYLVARGDFALTCEVSPSYRDIHITLQRKGTLVYEMNATAVQDIRVRKDATGETLEIVISERENILLAIKPEIRVLQQYEGAT